MRPKFVKNVSLAPKTSFQVGGPAKYYCEAVTTSDLVFCVSFAKSNDLPLFVLGDGTNVLVNDKGLDALVIRLTGEKVDFHSQGIYTIVSAEAGGSWDKLVGKVVKKGLQGVECLSGIPGSVGAAPVQNIGAYGQELSETLLDLMCFDTKTGKVLTFTNTKAKFGYRESLFKEGSKKGRFIVTSIRLKLSRGAPKKIDYPTLAEYLQQKGVTNPSLVEVRNAVKTVRRERLEDPQIVPNGGSFFKNPIVSQKLTKNLQRRYPDMPVFPFGKEIKLSAGWLIEQAGWKGKMYKSVGVSAKHALTIINPERKGTATEIIELAKLIARDVKKQFGVELAPEVQYIGF